jgi:ComF family protein
MRLDRLRFPVTRSRSGALLRRAGLAALDALLPPRCVACEAMVAVQGQFCGACFATISFITAPLCVRCGVPFASADQAGADELCPGCQEHPPLFRQARGALRYSDMARRLILPLKHADRTEMGAILAPMMQRAGAALLARADVLVPVPLHRRRLMARRYNQAALLAAALGRLAGCATLPLAMRRLRATQSLGDLSAAARARMVDGAFAVRPAFAARLSGRRILLIDDVLTSGATARACTLALLTAGAAAVDVLVAARVPSPVAADRPGAAASLH